MYCLIVVTNSVGPVDNNQRVQFHEFRSMNAAIEASQFLGPHLKRWTIVADFTPHPTMVINP